MTIDIDMLDMLRSSLRHVLTEESTQPLADHLAQLGWDEVVTDDAPTALRTLFEIKGETVSSADALGPTLARRLAERADDPSLASATITVPWPNGVTAGTGDTIKIDAIALSPLADRSVVIAVDGRLAVCAPGGIHAEALVGYDPLGMSRISGSTAVVRWIDPDLCDQVVADARWLVACELVGIGRHVVASAVEYTKQRVQYGQPIGVFQALQHRLASAHSTVVGAAHLATEAGIAGDPWSALVAKCMAGRAAETACTQAQQCYGAIGFTWEHEFHRYLRRTYTLDWLFGDWRSLEYEIGTQLQATHVVPHIGVL